MPSSLSPSWNSGSDRGGDGFLVITKRSSFPSPPRPLKTPFFLTKKVGLGWGAIKLMHNYLKDSVDVFHIFVSLSTSPLRIRQLDNKKNNNGKEYRFPSANLFISIFISLLLKEMKQCSLILACNCFPRPIIIIRKWLQGMPVVEFIKFPTNVEQFLFFTFFSEKNIQQTLLHGEHVAVHSKNY